MRPCKVHKRNNTIPTFKAMKQMQSSRKMALSKRSNQDKSEYSPMYTYRWVNCIALRSHTSCSEGSSTTHVQGITTHNFQAICCIPLQIASTFGNPSRNSQGWNVDFPLVIA